MKRAQKVMGTTLADLIRLIILILFLPLIMIFVGPLLVLAVLRGRQWMGPITLDSARYDFAGRAGMFMLGGAIWLLVWSGLVWLAVAATAPALTLGPAPANPVATTSPVETEPVIKPTATLIPSPTATLIANTSTPTPAPLIPTPTLGPIIPLVTNAPTSTPTPTPLFNETLATGMLVATLSVTGSTPAIPITVTSGEQQAIIAAIDQANVLLQNAITMASEENLENLAIVWRGRALVGMKIFATRISEKYTQPLIVQFEYITPPIIIAQNSPDQVVITSREKWSYGWFSNVDQDALEFTYTLDQVNGSWVITQYSYRDLPLPTPTIVTEDNLATTTPVTKD